MKMLTLVSFALRSKINIATNNYFMFKIICPLHDDSLFNGDSSMCAANSWVKFDRQCPFLPEQRFSGGERQVRDSGRQYEQN